MVLDENSIICGVSGYPFDKAEIHIYMPKENITLELKNEWLNKLRSERPNIKFEINSVDDFIK